MRGEDGRLLVEDYLRHLRDLNPGEDVADILQRKKSAARESRYHDLVAHDEARARMRADSDQWAKERAERRKELLAQCDQPDRVAAFRALRRYFTKHRYNPIWAIGGEAAKHYHATGEFPSQACYVILARPEGDLAKMVYRLVDVSDAHVFDGYLLFWGVYFDVVVVRSDWTRNASIVALGGSTSSVELPILRRDAWDYGQQRWVGKDIRFRTVQSQERGIEFGHTED
ncbi:MAG: hypothetical protein GY851_32725 [bacterium]|nr:hypothetical protein [bacterium]